MINAIIAFANARFDWSEIEKFRPLTEREECMRIYFHDMYQCDTSAIINDIAREAVSDCKEEGGERYDKVKEEINEMFADQLISRG